MTVDRIRRPDDQTLDFAQALLARADDPSVRKTERTRLRLLASIACELMADVERSDLKVAVVTRKAGFAHGTFYRYFIDIPSATAALIEMFSAFVAERLAGARDDGTGASDRVRSATLLFSRLFRRNAGLMRCLLGLDGGTLPFAAAYQQLNRDWYRRVAVAMARRRGEATPTPDALADAYALGGMIDDFLVQVYLRKEPALAHLADDEEKIADLLTRLWRFGAYGEAS